MFLSSNYQTFRPLDLDDIGRCHFCGGRNVENRLCNIDGNPEDVCPGCYEMLPDYLEDRNMTTITDPDEMRRDDYCAVYFGSTTLDRSGVIGEKDDGTRDIYPCTQKEAIAVIARMGRRDE